MLARASYLQRSFAPFFPETAPQAFHFHITICTLRMEVFRDRQLTFPPGRVLLAGKFHPLLHQTAPQI
jgi:hypothetical protein